MKCLLILSALIYAVYGATVPDQSKFKTPQQLTWNIVLPERQLGEPIEVNQGIRNMSSDDMLIRMPRKIIETDPESEEKDVYWRNWKGRIPSDAVIGGYTRSECGATVPIFLAQVYVKTAKAGLQPTQIFRYSKSVKPTYGLAQHETNENIKILCAEDQSILTWVPVNKTVHLDGEKDCVIGGTQEDSNMFFGRTVVDDEMIIGKASIKHRHMHYAYIGKELFTFDNFEILCYKRALVKIAEAERKNEVERMAKELMLEKAAEDE